MLEKLNEAHKKLNKKEDGAVDLDKTHVESPVKDARVESNLDIAPTGDTKKRGDSIGQLLDEFDSVAKIDDDKPSEPVTVTAASNK